MLYADLMFVSASGNAVHSYPSHNGCMFEVYDIASYKVEESTDGEFTNKKI